MSTKKELSIFQKIMFYGHDGKHSTYEAVRVKLDHEIDFDKMNAALQKAAARFPYFQDQLVEENSTLYLVRNEKEVKAHRDPPDYLINGNENDGFLYRVSVNGRYLTMSMFHGLSDAAGCIRFLKVILEHYYILSGEEVVCRKDDLYSCQSSAGEDEYTDPLANLPRDLPQYARDHTPFYQIKSRKTNHTNVYVFSADKESLMNYAYHSDGSPNAIAEILFARAINNSRFSRDHRAKDLPIRMGIAINAKKFLSSENSNQPALQLSCFDFTEKRFHVEPELLGTYIRGKMIADTSEEKLFPALAASRMIDRMFLYMPDIRGKKLLCKRSSEVPRNTATISYAGNIDFGYASKHIEQIFTYCDSCIPMLEINYLNGTFFFALIAKGDAADLAEAFVKEAGKAGITCSSIEHYVFNEGKGKNDGIRMGFNMPTFHLISASKKLKKEANTAN